MPQPFILSLFSPFGLTIESIKEFGSASMPLCSNVRFPVVVTSLNVSPQDQCQILDLVLTFSAKQMVFINNQ
jgi:hypothetical protein